MPTVPPSLGADPAYLAFLRALGVEDAQDTADANFKTAQIDRRLPMNLAQVGEQGTLQREQISGDAESRGVYRSGAHELALARERAAEGRQVTGLEADAADERTSIIAEVARRKAARARQAAEQGLTSADTLYDMGNS